MDQNKPRRSHDLRGWVDRVLLSVMGPPQIGDPNAPAKQVAAPPIEICPRCHQPKADHEVVREASLTFSRCPGDTPT